MGNRDLSDIGSQIRQAVEKAVSSSNFEELNKNISDSVNAALNEVRENVKGAVKYTGAEAGRWTDQAWKTKRQETDKQEAEKQKNLDHVNRSDEYAEYEPVREGHIRRTPVRQEQQGQREPVMQAQVKPEVRVNYPSRVSGILLTVFGSIGLGLFGILFLVVSAIGIFMPLHGLMTGGSVFFGIIAALFAGMLFVGTGKLGKLKRMKGYVGEAGSRMYCTVEQLSGAVGKPQKFVIKDVERMIKSGLLPEAHLDEKKTCLMFNRETYRQYQQMQQSYKERQQSDGKAAAKKTTEESAKGPEISEELRQMIASGKNYVRILREANDAIPGESISKKLSSLEDVIGRIFETVEKHPEQMGEMERFMDYYLPTTVKLVNAYRDFDGVNTAGGNVESAKSEIEHTLDTINQAFERLLDSLYEEAALDASTDASVLQAMLKSEGYAESDFKQTGEKK